MRRLRSGPRSILYPAAGSEPARPAGPIRPGFGSLRARLLALLALALALPAAIMVWQLDRQVAARLAAAEAAVLDSAQAIVREHVTLLDEARLLLRALALVPDVREARAGCEAVQAQLKALMPWAAALGVFDPSGSIRCSDRERGGDVQVGDRAHFQAAVATGDFAVSDVLTSRVDGRPVVAAALPVFDPSDQVQAVLIATIDAQHLARRPSRQGAGSDVAALLLDATGEALAAAPAAVGRVASPLAAAIGGQSAGVVRVVDPDGTRRIFGFGRVPESRAWVAVGRDEAAVLAPAWREAEHAAALLLAAALVAGVVTAWLGENVLVRGIAGIAAAAETGSGFAAVRPGRLAAPEVHALQAALIANEERREAIERRWRTLGESDAQIVWRADPSGRMIEGVGWEALTGRPIQAATFGDGGSTAHPEDGPARIAAWRRALATGQPYAAEFRLSVPARPGGPPPAEPAPDGRVWLWVRSRALPVRDAAGAIVEWVGTLHVIDGRRRADAALAEREARLRSVLQTASDAIVVIDATGTLHEINPAAERLFGWRAAEAVGRNVSVLMSGADAAAHDGHLARHVAAGGGAVLGMGRELEAVRRDGTTVPVEISVGQFHDAAGRGFYTGILRDISARRTATHALAESERRFRLLAENSDDVVVLNDLNGVRLYVSPSSMRVLGWPPEALIGRRATELVHPDDRTVLQAAIAAITHGQPASEATYRLRRPDGSWVWVEGRARASLDADGRNTGYVVALRDATERIAAEARLRDAFERMEELAATDGLTGLANRRHFDDALRHEWRRAEREELPLSIAILDADRFKLFNDRYGHPAGDDCLRGIAAALGAAARRGADLAARHGGEEFALLMPATDAAGAALVAERIRAFVEADARPHAGNPPGGVVTVSVGTATAFPWATGSIASPDALLSIADEALYAAKTAGRNRVVAADTLPAKAAIAAA